MSPCSANLERHLCHSQPALFTPERAKISLGRSILCAFMEPEKFKQGSLGTVGPVQGLRSNVTVFASDLAITLCHSLLRPLKFTAEYNM